MASAVFFYFILFFSISSADEEQLLIERSARTGMLNPGDPWQTFIHDGAVGHIVYRVRVRCDENYYSSKCNKLCVPRDDYFGHYRCEASGAQVCLDGWMGPDCRTGTRCLFFLFFRYQIILPSGSFPQIPAPQNSESF